MKKKFFITLISVALLISAAVLNKALSQNTSDPRINYDKANTMLVSGNFEEAIRLYNIAIQQNPKYAEAYLGLGIAYKETGRNQEAYDATSKVIKLRPSYYQAYYNLGIVLENLGRNNEAINAYNKFLDEVPGAERFSDVKQRIARLKKYKN